MILLQTFVFAAIVLLEGLLLALYVTCVDKFLESRPYLRDSLGFYVVVAAGCITTLVLYGGFVAQMFVWAERMGA